MDNFTIHSRPSRIQLFRVVCDGLESSSIWRELALSAMLATDDPGEQNASAVKYAISITSFGSKNANI